MQFINLERILITFSFLIPRDNRCNQIPWMKHTRNRDHYRETIVANQNVAVFHDLIDNVRHGTIVSLCHRSTFRWKEEISIYIKQKLHIVDFFNQKIIITFRSIAQVPSPLIEGLFFSRRRPSSTIQSSNIMITGDEEKRKNMRSLMEIMILESV